MRALVAHITLFMLCCSAVLGQAQSRSEWDASTYRYNFTRVDSFLNVFTGLSQFRKPGGDTLCTACLEDFKGLFADNFLYPDIINPIWLNSGEMVYTNRVIPKSLDRFARDVQSNFPGGLMIRYRGINYNFQSISNDYFEVVIERRIRGQAKNRWRVDLTDTVMVRASGFEMGIKIQGLDILGFSYALTDIKELTKALSGSQPDIYLRSQMRQWERAQRARKKRDFAPALAMADSVAKNSPCACADRVPKTDAYYSAFNQYVPGSKRYKKSAMVAFSDRSGNFSRLSPDAVGEIYRELEFLQPFFIVDTAADYVHIVEYNPSALNGSDLRLKRCLADYGWIKKERLLLGAYAQQKGGDFEIVQAEEQSEQPDRKAARALCFRVFENPALNNERIEPPAAGKLYVYKRLENAVLLGNKPDLQPSQADEVVLGWKSISGLKWNSDINQSK
jgi:hypothetical protein